MITRRSFVAGMANAAFGATIVPRHVLGGPGFVAPSDRVNVALVGAGGRGSLDIAPLLQGDQNLVAIADVDFANVESVVKSRMRAANAAESGASKLEQAYGKATRYSDLRQMLDRQRDIDAVLIATPDHLHAVAAKRAMELGKHVYVEKPLGHTVHETRVLADVARRTGVVTQMGNQGRSSDDVRLVYEWIQAGVIGPVREVHVWTDSPRWPSGILRPDAGREIPAEVDWRRDVPSIVANALGGDYPVPPSLHWDLFLGPAPRVDYHPIYHPRNWRGWTDWGVSALGDMGAHLLDPPVTALDLGLPSTVQATSTDWGGDPSDPVSYPVAMTAHYEFPRRGSRPPVDLHWYDGGMLPQRPKLLPDEVAFANGGGYFVGEKGILLYSSYGANPQLFPRSLHAAAEAVPQRYPRVGTSHQMNWIQAIRGEAEATSPFSVAAPLTELILLGLVALRTGQGARIRYDGPGMRVTSHQEANRFLRREEYRTGWELAG